MKKILTLCLLIFLGVTTVNAQTWQYVGSPNFSTNYYIGPISLAFNGNTPYVYYEDHIQSGGVKSTVKKFDGTNWVNVGTPGFLTNGADFVSFTINGNTPYLAYMDWGVPSGGGSKASVMKFDGTNWVNVGVAGFSPGAVNYTSLAFDGNTSYVAFQDRTDVDVEDVGPRKCTVMKFDGTNWVLVGAAKFSAGDVYDVSLKINNGIPYVAFVDADNLNKVTVMKFDGTNWVSVGSAGFSGASSSYISLAFNGNTPYVSYADGGNGGKATLKKFDGTNWVSVGSGGFSGGSSGYTSLAFKGNTPYVSYYDGANGGRVTVQKFDGTNWITVGAAGFSQAGLTNSTSLAFNGNVPCVAFGSSTFQNGFFPYQANVMQFGTPCSATTSTTNLSICSGALPYTWNGKTLTGAGTLIDTLTNAGGCDSVATLNLTIKANHSITANAGSNGSISNAGATTVCDGNNQTYTITASGGYSIADVLVDGVSQGSISSYTFTNVTANHAISASFSANCVASSSSTSQTACGSFTWNAQTYTTSGDKVAHFTNSCGLDSAATLHLTITQPSSSTTDASICSGSSYSFNGNTYTTAGTRVIHLTNAAGCDSAATLNLTVTSLSTPSISIVADANNVCFGTTVTFTATPVNGGTAPTYQWKKNGVNVGININTYSSTTLNNNDSIWCVLTSNSACATTATATGNKVKMIIKAVPAVPTISSGATINCTIGSSTNMASNYWNTTWVSSNPSVATVTYPGAGGSNSAYINALSNGTTSITFSVVNVANGCTNSASANYVVAAANAGTITAASGVCLGKTITAINNISGGVWSFSNNKALVNASGILTGNSVGIGVLSYKVTNIQGCNATTTKAITTYALPSAPTVSSLTAKPYCKGATFNVTASPTTGAWTTSNASTSAATGSPIIVTLGNTVGASSLTYTITDVNGCSNSKVTTATILNCVGSRAANVVAESMHQQINLYPNPAKGVVSLQVEQLIGKGTVVITDVYGKAVYSFIVNSPSTKIDISHLNKGLYLVSMISNEGKVTKKLIVE